MRTDTVYSTPANIGLRNHLHFLNSFIPTLNILQNTILVLYQTVISNNPYNLTHDLFSMYWVLASDYTDSGKPGWHIRLYRFWRAPVITYGSATVSTLFSVARR